MNENLVAQLDKVQEEINKLRAMMTDPICNNIPDGEACIRDLLVAQRDALPRQWY